MKKLSSYQVKRGLQYFRKHGVKQFVRRFGEKTGIVETAYPGWFEKHRTSERELAEQRERCFSDPVLFSFVVPAYNTPERYLRALIDSLLAQTYTSWELCLADGSPDRDVVCGVVKEYADARIHYRHLEENYGISGNTNAALEMAAGDFLVLADHDDLLEPDALFRMMEVLEQDPETDVIYTDEGKITMDGSRIFDPHFKSDFNWWLLRSNNYICHIFAVRASIGKRVGGFCREYDGAQDYDYILKCCEKAEKIAHIPRILYHWRAHPGSTAGDPASKSYAYEAGCRALNDHYQRTGIQARAEYTGLPGRYRTRFELKETPKICVLLTYTGKEQEVLSCVKALREGTDYPCWDLWILAGNRQKISPETLEKLGEVTFFWRECHSLPELWNRAAEECGGSYLLFLNGVYRPVHCDWIRELLGQCMQENVGAAGAKLLYSDRKICQAGVCVGMYAAAGNEAEGAKYLDEGCNAWNNSNRNVSAVTDVVLTPRKVWEALSGVKTEYKSYLAMVDYCLRAGQLGYGIVYTPWAELKSGQKFRKDRQRWEKREGELFRKAWAEFLDRGDPFYSPNLSLGGPDFRYSGSDEKYGER